MEVSHSMVEYLKFNYLTLDHGFNETNSVGELCQLYTGKLICLYLFQKVRYWSWEEAKYVT